MQRRVSSPVKARRALSRQAKVPLSLEQAMESRERAASGVRPRLADAWDGAGSLRHDGAVVEKNGLGACQSASDVVVGW
jgi:hypothetical protein